MPRLPALTSREIIRVLERAGFFFRRQKGSHQIFVKDYRRVTVPYHNKDVRVGTLRHIIKQSGLTTQQFLDLL